MRCGGTFHQSAFDFHHRDPKEKSFGLGVAIMKSWATIKNELDKCDLLCAHCHRLLHWEETNV